MKRCAKDEQLTFETALENLEAVVKDLEDGEIALDSLLEKYAEGVKLSKYCLTELNRAEKAIDKMLKSDRGKIVETTLEIEGE